MIERLTLLALCALLTACGVPHPRSDSEHAAAAGGPAAGGPAAGGPAAGVTHVPRESYRIDTARSEVRLLVYRAGALANLGHNHVITNRNISGSVKYAGAVAGSEFQLSIPVSEFSVDETAVRAAEGADFPGTIPDDAKTGTLHNMLSAALLDAAEHPRIDVHGTVVRGATGITAMLEAHVAGHVSSFPVPLTLDAQPGELHASGSVALRQTDLGLTPFSIMLGAIQVQNELRIKFTIVAVPQA